MKTRIFKNWIATFFGVLIGLLGTESYFQFFDAIREINLVTYVILLSLTLLFIFSTNSALLKFAQATLDLLLFKKNAKRD